MINFLLVGDQPRANFAYKVSKHRVFSGPYFPVFGLNTDQKNSLLGHFLRSAKKKKKIIIKNK